MGENQPRQVIPNPQYVEKPSFRLKYLCYGCNKALRSGQDVPLTPFNVVVCCNEYRTYVNKNTGHLQMTLRKTDCHFHLRLLEKHPDFNAASIVITELDKAKITKPQKQQFLREFWMAVGE